uniref:Uncharacterized protein n=1 Tax=viral metagenome TaxID=1070528 RepID=A0A6M3J0X0_9ZZZZ
MTKTVTQLLREHLYETLGMLDISYNTLLETEWSPNFERLMRNRLILGALRYGRLRAIGKPKWDRVEYIERKLKDYKETKNKECLVDIANLCLCEFIEGDSKVFMPEDNKTQCKEKENV